MTEVGLEVLDKEAWWFVAKVGIEGKIEPLNLLEGLELNGK